MPVFTANVPGLLKIGDKIEIGGKIKENSRKMSVNLCTQEGEEPRDVVLHFDVRFHRDNIISLSRKNGIWIGSGNYDTNYNMFVPGTIFRIVFEIKDTDVITIYCQGKFHSNFLPKIPLSMARFIVAWGDVERITHCYFHLGNKALGDETSPAPCPPLPRPNQPTVAGDAKRWATSNIYYGPDSNVIYQVMPTGTRPIKVSPRMPKKGSRSSPGSPQPHIAHSSNESSDEEFKGRHKDNRTERYFYETLMCPQVGAGMPRERHRDPMRRCPEYNKKSYHRDVSDSEKNESEIYSEDISKNDSTIGESEDILPEMKRHRRKFAPFSQVVSFMEKNGKRN